MQQQRLRRTSLAAVVVMITAMIPLTAVGSEHTTPIHDVQGSGTGTPIPNTVVTIEGVVVGNFPGFSGLRGFYVQEQDGEADADAKTSEGIFVFSTASVSVGDLVEVTGTAGEFGDQTQLGSVSNVTVLSSGHTVTPTVVALPVEDQADLEAFEGMLVTFEQHLFISEFFNFDRFGEIVLTTARQFQGTQVAEPGAAAGAVAEMNALSRITLDDGSNSQNPSFLRHPDGDQFTLTNFFRGGDVVRDVTGVLGEGFDLYRIQPTEAAEHVVMNPRPTTPKSLGGDLTIASFNVLNFFANLDDGPDNCGPTGNLECRGADFQAEYERQLAKLVSGILALDADVVGIQEIENDIRTEDGNPAHFAVQELIGALNDAEGAGTWAWVGEANHYNDYPVRNDIIYQTATVEPVGDPVALADDAFDIKRPGDIEPVGRPPLAQAFRPIMERGSAQPFTVVVNHFKSKGTDCNSLGDPDTGDGQANCNLTRVAQSEALLDFVEVLQEDSSGVLVIGDLNSYAMEDPIDVLKKGGLTNLVDLHEGNEAYSFVFDGQLGNLDHALATRSMLNFVTGATVFHINADEADVFDYDMSFKPAAQEALFEGDKAYRVSDHDPVLVGVSFGGAARARR
jgi:predicted extracellular nuclease